MFLQQKNSLIFTQSILIISALIVISGCASTIVSHNLHIRIANTTTIKQILLLPIDLRIDEDVTENISETVPNLTATTSQVITNATKVYLKSKLGIQTIDYDEENVADSLQEYVALIDQVTASIYKHTNSYSWDAWPHKNKQFDYSIGNGLAFLKNESIDAIMVIKGNQNFSVLRKNMTFEKLYLVVSIINVKTGDVLWVDFSEHPGFDIRKASTVKQLLSNVFKSFPKNILALSN